MVRRIAAFPALVALILSLWPNGAAPAVADHFPEHDPVARLQIVIKSVTVHDDSDWGEGEIRLHLFFLRVDPSCPAYTLEDACLKDLFTVHFPELGMDDGETRQLDRIVPLTEDSVVDDGSVSTAFGLPVFPGRAYHMVIYGYETDTVPGFDDFLGRIDRIISEGDGWVAPSRVQRSVMDDSGKGAGGPGKFSIEYEIRRIPLPDLEPTDLEVLRLPGTPADTNDVCVSVLNRGAMDAGPFQVWLVLNGGLPPLATVEVGQLPTGQHVETCLKAKLPTSGSHYLTALVDQPRGIFEENDTNNRWAEPYVAPQNVVGVQPTPTPGAQKADLFAAGISVRGEQTNGTSGCDPGLNDITISVKNLGDLAASAFVVRLTAKPENDDNSDRQISREQTINTLAAGGSADVTFNDVRFNRGFHELKAVVDLRKTISETDEDDNEIILSVNCQP